MFLTTFTVSANVKLLSQQVTLNFENAALTEVLSSLKEQTGHMVIYSHDRLEKEDSRVTISMKNVRLSAALDELLKDLPYTYSIVDQMVMIIPAPAKTAQNQTQTHPITGTVVDSDGRPLPGVAIIVKGTTNGVATDANGRFRLPNVRERSVVLHVSFLGKKPLEITATQGSDITIRLEDAEQKIEDVVVTGYQTIARDRATGSFGSISQAELAKPTADIASRLVGTVSGVQTTTDADGKISFEIRGKTSFANAQPLVVVDGFPITGDLSSLNPNDIQSITILKDAAAASIWGAQAANGVIAVVTRRATNSSPTKVEVNMFYSFSPKIDLDYANPLASSAMTIEYEKLHFEAWYHEALSDDFYSILSGGGSAGLIAMTEHANGYLSDSELNSLLDSYRKLDNRSQIKKYLLQNASKQQINVSVSGGNERMSNYVSALYQRQAFSPKEKDNWKGALDYRTNVKLAKWLDFSLDASFTYKKDRDNSVPYDNISPYEMLVNPDGSRPDISQYVYLPALYRYIPAEDLAKFPYEDWTYNPITELENQDKTVTHLNGRLQASLRFKIIDGLTFTTSGQYQINDRRYRDLYGEKTHKVRIGDSSDAINTGGAVNTFSKYDPDAHTVTPNLPKGAYLDQKHEREDQWMLRQQIDFNRIFAEDHAVSVVFGTEIKQNVWEQAKAPRTYGYNEETLASSPYPNGPYSTKNRLVGMLGARPRRAPTYIYTFDYNNRRFFNLYATGSYTYKNRYTISGSVRTDASNLITDDPKYRYAPFWSVGGSWIISREDFMSDVSWLDDLTVRATYGYNGNVDTSTAPQPLLKLDNSPNDYTGGRTASIASYGNPTLRWERTGQINLGVWYSMFGGKLTGKLEFYDKQGKDLIAKLAIPSVNGTESQKLNNAAIRNTGFELEIGTHQNIKGTDIQWSGNLNVSYNKNKVTDLFVVSHDASYMADGYSYVEGYNADALWMYAYNGMVDVAPAGADANWQPSIKGVKDGEYFLLNTYTPDSGATEYMRYMGTKQAPWVLGMTNTFKIFDFDLSFIMTAKLGHVFARNGFNYPFMGFDMGRALPNKHIKDVISADGTRHDGSKYIPIPLTSDQSDYYFWETFTPYMDYLCENAGHIRMQEISLGYNLPKHVSRKLGLDAVKVYAQVNNAFNIYFNKYNQDPEYPEGTIKPTALYTFGLKVTF